MKATSFYSKRCQGGMQAAAQDIALPEWIPVARAEDVSAPAADELGSFFLGDNKVPVSKLSFRNAARPRYEGCCLGTNSLDVFSAQLPPEKTK